jgi:hypothetical protein
MKKMEIEMVNVEILMKIMMMIKRRWNLGIEAMRGMELKNVCY